MLFILKVLRTCFPHLGNYIYNYIKTWKVFDKRSQGFQIKSEMAMQDTMYIVHCVFYVEEIYLILKAK
jgi:hypothetical protein